MTSTFFSALLVAFFPVASLSGEIELKISAEANRVLIGEPLMISITATNVSNHDILIPVTWDVRTMILTIGGLAPDPPNPKPDDGSAAERKRLYEREPPNGPFGLRPSESRMADSERLLRPGASYTDRFNIVSRAELNRQNKPGKYTFQVTFDCPGEFVGLDEEAPMRDIEDLKTVRKICWKGRVQSNAIEIEIVNPTKPQDMKALEILLGRIGRLNYRTYSMEEDLQRVINECPASTYAKYCHFFLGKRRATTPNLPRGRECLKSIPFLSTVVEKYVRFSFTDDALFLMADVLWATKQHDEAEKLVQKVQKEFSDSDILLSEEWKQLMESMQRQKQKAAVTLRLVDGEGNAVTDQVRLRCSRAMGTLKLKDIEWPDLDSQVFALVRNGDCIRLKPGHWSIQVEAKMGSLYYGKAELDVKEGEVLDFTFRLESLKMMEFEVRVTSEDGKPVEGVSVTARVPEHPDLVSRATTDAAGMAHLSVEGTPARISLGASMGTIPSDGIPFRYTTALAELEKKPDAPLELILRKMKTSAMGEAVLVEEGETFGVDKEAQGAQAFIRFHPKESTMKTQFVPVKYGRFRFLDLPSGTYVVESLDVGSPEKPALFSCRPKEPCEFTIAGNEDAPVQLHTVAFLRWAERTRITVRLDGLPKEEAMKAQVCMQRISRNGQPAGDPVIIKADAGGAFRSRRVPGGRYDVTVESDGKTVGQAKQVGVGSGDSDITIPCVSSDQAPEK